MTNDITFEGYKSSIIEYMSGQDEFKDFNYTAPGITTLIDALAYMGYKMSLYANFALNECFLDTAQQRTSIVSKAKNIGYIPYQYTSAKAKVKLSYTGKDNIDNMIIPVGTTFLCKYNGSSYYFRTTEAVEVKKTNVGRYYVELSLTEGTIISQSFIQTPDENTQFILSNPNVNTDSLIVKVYSSSTDTIGVEYFPLKSVTQLGPTNAVYSIEENTDGFVQLIFGDGIISKKISSGNIVRISYRTTVGSEANGISVFTFISVPNNVTDPSKWSVECTEIAYGGSDRESNASIQRNAPKFFQRQGRNVIAEDYKTALLTKYGGIIDAINVWGGENNIPPMYGNAVVCVKPNNSTKLTTAQKNEMEKYLESDGVIGISIKFIDPTVLYVNMSINAKFNKLYSNNSYDYIKNNITSTTLSYFNNNVSSFNTEFIYSKYLSELFSIDSAISDIDTSISLYQYFIPVIDTKYTYNIKFNNAIQAGSVYIGPYLSIANSSQLIYMDDDSNGVLRIHVGDTVSNVGNVNYEAGDVNIVNYMFKTIQGDQITVMAKPYKNNITVKNNYVLSIDNISVTVNGE